MNMLVGVYVCMGMGTFHGSPPFEQALKILPPILLSKRICLGLPSIINSVNTCLTHSIWHSPHPVVGLEPLFGFAVPLAKKIRLTQFR